MTFVISSMHYSLDVSFIVIATNITIIGIISSSLLCHHYQSSCRLWSCRRSVSSIEPFLYIVLQLTSSAHFIEVQRMFSISLSSSQKECVFTALNINTAAILKQKTNTLTTVYVCRSTRQPVSHIDLIYRGRMTKIWRQSDTAYCP